MEFEDQEERGMEEEEEEEEEVDEEEMESPPVGYDSSRVKMANTGRERPAATTTLVVAHQPTTTTMPRYRECLKNHAVGLGGHAVDGCGEFMPGGAEGTLDALKCAACNCHRNFHRKESAESFASPTVGRELFFHGHPPPHSQPPHHLQLPPFTPYYRTPAGYLHVPPQQQRPLALPSISGGGGGHSREDQEDLSNPSGGSGGYGGISGSGAGSSSRKRFRTKFTQEQKEKMLALAERLEWRMQKHDEALVQQFCNETGLKRHVLKVWMHNNKSTLGKKP